MSEAVQVTVETNIARISGEVGFATVMGVLSQLRKLAQQKKQHWQLDLSAVTRVDSSALALLIELKRMTRQAESTLEFVELPESVITIAHLSQVESLLQNQD